MERGSGLRLDQARRLLKRTPNFQTGEKGTRSLYQHQVNSMSMNNGDGNSARPGAAQLMKFKETVESNKNVLFCVQCGSSVVDQSSINSLRCTNCGNTALWNGHRFGVARDASAHDVISALMPPARPDYFDDPFSRMIKALQEFGETAIQFGIMELEEDKAAELAAAWYACKQKIDGLIAEAPRS